MATFKYLPDAGLALTLNGVKWVDLGIDDAWFSVDAGASYAITTTLHASPAGDSIIDADLSTELHAALAALGDTADDIAETFRATGMRGTPQDPHRCPIANQLRAAFRTDGVNVASYAEMTMPDGRRARAALPAACLAFMNRFDGSAVVDHSDCCPQLAVLPPPSHRTSPYADLVGAPPTITPVPIEATPHLPAVPALV